MDTTVSMINSTTQLSQNSTETVHCGSECRLANTYQLMFARPEWKAAQIIEGEVSLATQSVGFLGNILALIILCRPGMRQYSSAIYLIALAVADACMLFSLILNNLTRYFSKEDWDGNAFCKAVRTLTFFASSSSSWITVAVTAERCIAVCYPLKASTLCTRKKAGVIITVVTTAAVSFCMQNFWYSIYDPIQGICTFNERYMHILEIIVWVATVFGIYIPMASILVLNIVIAKALKKAAISRRQMMSDAAAVSDVDKATKQLTMTVVAISFTSILCTTPLAIWGVTNALVKDPTSPISLARFSLFWSVSVMLAAFNHGVNFLLYVFSGKKFREEFCNVFCCSVVRNSTPKGQV